MRYLKANIEETIGAEKKMAFITGPRQVGKTTLAQHLLKEASCEAGYFNWDIEPVRRMTIEDPVGFWQSTGPRPPPRIALDEIHKYPRWKKFLKGFFDANRGQVEVIVTGSGRLDVYQKGGDSLFGRSHLYHLAPYSVGELQDKPDRDLSPEACFKKILDEPPSACREAFESLWSFSGFPEPLFAGDQKRLERWRNDHRQLILREDLRDLTRIREIGLIESLIYLLPGRVGSPLSVNALREDLNVNFRTVQNWLSTLDRLYFLFTIRPFEGRLARTLRHEEKLYFYDWSELEDDAKRFENLVAVHLLKACHYWTDTGYGLFQLHYVRDKEKREVDFLVTNKRNPLLLIECKLSEKQTDRSLIYFREKLKPPHSFQVLRQGEPDFFRRSPEGIFTCSAARFLGALP